MLPPGFFCPTGMIIPKLFSIQIQKRIKKKREFGLKRAEKPEKTGNTL